jgi:hypothetical protein
LAAAEQGARLVFAEAAVLDEKEIVDENAA